MSRDVLLVRSDSANCLSENHAACHGRLLLKRELNICACQCHDEPIGTHADKERIISEWAAKLGRRGGKKGGPARALALKPSKRRAIALLGAVTRWGHKRASIEAVRERLRQEP